MLSQGALISLDIFVAVGVVVVAVVVIIAVVDRDDVV